LFLCSYSLMLEEFFFLFYFHAFLNSCTTSYDFHIIINKSSLPYSYDWLVIFLYQKENKDRAFLGDMSRLERVGKGVGYWESHNVFLSLPAALFMKVCLDCPPLCEQFVQLNHVLSLSHKVWMDSSCWLFNTSHVPVHRRHICLLTEMTVLMNVLVVPWISVYAKYISAAYEKNWLCEHSLNNGKWIMHCTWTYLRTV